MELKRLFEYDLWANRKIFAAFQELEDGEAKSEINKMFSHTLAAQKIWAKRIEGNKPKIEVWPELSGKEMQQLMSANHERLLGLISKKEAQFSYKNSAGNAYHSKTEDILMHVVIHGQHHRAQIARMLRAEGINPPGTDFLFFIRED
jgi:uncharacterized damage-inducible protein DinB